MRFIWIDTIEQTHDSLIANWITMFDYSEANNSLSHIGKLENGYPYSKSPYRWLAAMLDDRNNKNIYKLYIIIKLIINGHPTWRQ